ncbi:hypothetical protein CCAX7_62400 [Capsulimonas corticalis]|uniref:Uncharacterized protein n=1 Tax=Capsulimonas corticalis TaxID=2219043 RepID=A0A402CWK9_9BACT|nr:hypothetical protein CCAX7_62400 [Capsulimonas corticalis]
MTNRDSPVLRLVIIDIYSERQHIEAAWTVWYPAAGSLQTFPRMTDHFNKCAFCGVGGANN